MKKRRKNEHGAITVFLSMVLVIIIAFMGMLVDIARMRVAESQVKRASQLALDSVMTDYSRRLREDYGLFGYAGSADDVDATFQKYFQANLRPAAQAEDDQFMQLMKTIAGVNEIRYGDMLNLQADAGGSAGIGSDALSDPDALYKQVIEFSKFRVPIDMVMNNSLGDFGDFTAAMENMNNDIKAYDRMDDLGGPMEEYWKKKKELSDAVALLEKAVGQLYNSVISWNKFVNGESDEEIGFRQGIPITYSEYYALKDNEGFINGHGLYKNVPGDINTGLDATAYDVDDTVEAFEDLKGDVEDDVVDLATASIIDEYNYQSSQVKNQLNKIEDEGEKEILEDRNEYGKMIVESCIDEAEQNVDGLCGEIQQSALNIFGEALEIRTKGYLDAYGACEDGVDYAIDKVKEALQAARDAQKDVKDTIEDIDVDISSMEASSTAKEDWKNGDKADTEQQLFDDFDDFLMVETRVSNLEKYMETLEQINDYDESEVALDFMNNGVIRELNGNTSSWNRNNYQMTYVTFEGDYSLPDTDDKYTKNKDAADDQKNAAEKAAKELGGDKVTYNDTKIPSDYRDRFISIGEMSETYTANDGKYDSDLKNVKAADVKNDSSNQSAGLDSIVGKISGGIQYILGTVYTSEYIMRMFSNAAPTQDENQYKAETYEPKKVITLKNKIPVGVDDYNQMPAEEKKNEDEYRFGYFYNAEVEYILFGKNKESDNVEWGSKVMLQLILTASNYLQVRRNETLRPLVESAAAAGLVIGIPSTITRFVLYMGFAVAETQFDMFYLMRGFKIPAFCMKGNQLFMMNLTNANDILGIHGEFMLSYEFYLRVRLMAALVTNYRDVMQRMANLIQLNINYVGDNMKSIAYDSDSGFEMKSAYTTFEATAKAHMPYWFMAMAMMGEARSESGKFDIPESTIMASY